MSENHKYTIKELLGILTSLGKHYTGIVHGYSIILLEDLSDCEISDAKVRKECIEHAKTLVEQSQKHSDLIETVLKEWKKINQNNE